MRETLQSKIRRFSKNNRYRQVRRKVLQVLSGVVVFCTTYALILPAITLEKKPICGIEEHTHTQECYVKITTRDEVQLNCSYETLDVHVHSEDCLDENGNRICGLADYIAHEHTSVCWGGTYSCTLPEIKLHTHTLSECYRQEYPEVHKHDESCIERLQGDLTCKLDEGEGHAHDQDLCYTLSETPVCGQEETAGHSHTDACNKKNLICELTVQPHIHGTDCYIQLVCELTEDETHTHTDECNGKQLNCELTEEPHEHTDECYETVLGCGLDEFPAHSHTRSCYDPQLTCTEKETPAHTHGDSCYAWTENYICGLKQGQGIGDPVDVLDCEKTEYKLHTHDDSCYNIYTDEYGVEHRDLICPELELYEHQHTGSCLITVEVPMENAEQLTCTLSEGEDHTHGDMCYGTWELKCTQTEHTHVDECYPQVTYYCGQEEHAHAEGCYDADGNTVCTVSEHTHTDECLTEKVEPTYYCGQEAHTHGDTCADPCEITEHEHTDECLTEQVEVIYYCCLEAHTHGEGCADPCELPEHNHTDACLVVPTYYCGQEAHTHGDCGEDCALEEHTHSVECLTPQEEPVYYCGKDEHSHDESCPGSCELEEHTHTDECLVEPTYYCGLEEHTHSDTCPEDCALEEHTHTDECLVEPEDVTYLCGLEEHEHSSDCCNDEGYIICDTPIHTHGNDCLEEKEYLCGEDSDEGHTHTSLCLVDLSGLPPSGKRAVTQVIQLIDDIPCADEIDAQIQAFDDAENYDAEEEWSTDVYQRVGEAYKQYHGLGNTLQSYVVNRDKLLELEYIWSVKMLPDITSATPTVASSASTRDFVTINLYDYNWYINSYWSADKKYPGFSWNGGAQSGDNSYVPTDGSDTALGIPGYHTNRYQVNSIDFGNSMITNFNYAEKADDAADYGISKSATNVVNQGGNINAAHSSGINRPIGITNGTEVMSRTLVNGYPALVDGTSLSYLFGDEAADSYNAVSKQNSGNIDGLFKYNNTTGEYSYNSRENHAQFNGTDTITLYNQILTPNFLLYPFGNFMPFNTISDPNQATQVGALNGLDSGGNGYMNHYVNNLISRMTEYNAENPTDYHYSSREQLIVMLQEYMEHWTWNPTTNYVDALGREIHFYNLTSGVAIMDFLNGTTGPGNESGTTIPGLEASYLNKLYNIDWDVPTNFFFGMDMQMRFMQPKDGMTGMDTNGDGYSDSPMKFYFTGDDDVWVYIDDVLFLDLTGIHRHVGGEIDFVNGVVKYTALDVAQGDVSSEPYATYTFEELFRAAYAEGSQELTDALATLNDKGTFKDYSTHKFNFYYMERGSGSSVCRINFNFPLLRQNAISVAKVLTVDDPSIGSLLGDPDFKYRILKADADGTLTDELFIDAGVTYDIYDSRTNTQIGTGTTDENGIFTIKSGQRAEFGGIDENRGKYYVQELLDKDYFEQYGIIEVDGTTVSVQPGDIAFPSEEVFVGVNSPVKDAADGITMFNYTNNIERLKLGDLSITKNLSGAATDKTFDMNVELDSAPIPAGTPYTLYASADDTTGTPKQVNTPGVISLAPGQRAELKNIVAGTPFKVSESTASGKGYVVTYTQTNATHGIISDDGVTGFIGVGADVAVVVNNSENAAKVQIPGSKRLTNPSFANGQSFTFTINCTAAVDQGGTTLQPFVDKDYPSQTVTLTKEAPNPSFNFELSYTELEFPDGTQFPVTLTYEIREAAPDASLNSTHDESVYIATVQVDKSTNGAMSARLTSLTKGDATATSADFVNTLLGELSLKKLVEHGGNAQNSAAFNFQLKLTDANGAPLANQTYQSIRGGETKSVVTDTDGVITISDLHHDEMVTIQGLPLGTQWTITETNSAGYIVSWTANTDSGISDEATGNIPAGGMAVVFTNTSSYELPHTGGGGTTAYAMAGLALILFSMAFLLYNFKARRREGA